MSKAWMPLYIGDYKRDTAHLSTLEHGAYLLLIMHYWETGPLPNENKRLAKIAGLSRQEWAAMAPPLKAFFQYSHDGKFLHHKRIDEELAKAELVFQKRSLAGQKGGLFSRGKTNVMRLIGEANVKQTGKQSQSHSYFTDLSVAARSARKRPAEEDR